MPLPGMPAGAVGALTQPPPPHQQQQPQHAQHAQPTAAAAGLSLGGGGGGGGGGAGASTSAASHRRSVEIDTINPLSSDADIEELLQVRGWEGGREGRREGFNV